MIGGRNPSRTCEVPTVLVCETGELQGNQCVETTTVRPGQGPVRPIEPVE